MIKNFPPIHPGEILMEEFLKPLNISQYRLAKDIHVPPIRINEIVHGLRSISVDSALRLSKYFGNSAEFWLNLQNKYDLEIKSEELFEELEIKVKIFPITYQIKELQN
ncbi:addiction module antidote protein, HigA family [Candidatus Peregrinibacteria bacterium RIFOXYB2_FULL_32_7]|nr:MAG: addiction module antidote protein, HigA family [Candidatus Peregrinibacteria bacterium RIFOXYB2_FULL_32_7]